MRIAVMTMGVLTLVLAACGGGATTGTNDAAGGAAGGATSAADTSGGAAAVAPGTLPGEPVTGDGESLDGGLKYYRIKEGTGELPKQGQTVSVHYSGYLTDGTPFDSSLNRGQPLQFPLGTANIIQGWNLGIAHMKVGEKGKLVIPSDLAYGAQGYGGGVIPPNATLVFDLELVAVQ